ncbi:MAG: NUDIX domain-containing protein [Lachnospiraceae bacterium]|nr:NUDIX domain-containing protein [Lachnospiraceae bacterium]
MVRVMRMLAEYDHKNYIENGTVGIRPSVRGVVIRGDKIALVYSSKYDYYKFPGGGIDEGETHQQTLIREVLEESGLVVIPSSIKEYGVVLKKEKGKYQDLFIQESFYYFCDAEREEKIHEMDDDEREEGFMLKWVDPKEAIETNLHHDHGEKSNVLAKNMMLREANVLKMLIDENYFSKDK